MSDFDPTAFLDGATEQVSERMPNLPAGQDYISTIESVDFRKVQGKKDPAATFLFMDVKHKIDTSRVEINGHAYPTPTRTIVDGFIVNTKEGNPNAIDYGPGKNGRIRQYREALGLNEAGVTFSPRAMIGRQLRVKTKLDPYEGDFFDKIDSVAKA
jgi:hypothetical protein